jgi:hypothetical protein
MGVHREVSVKQKTVRKEPQTSAWVNCEREKCCVGIVCVCCGTMVSTLEFVASCTVLEVPVFNFSVW